METLSFVLPAKTTLLKAIRLLWFWREEQNSEFPKIFFGGYLSIFVEYLCNRSPKIKTKNIKNYSSILAIVNHRNWLDNKQHETASTLCSVPNVQSQLTVTPWIKKDKLKQANNARQHRNFNKQITHDKNSRAGSVALRACGTVPHK